MVAISSGRATRPLGTRVASLRTSASPPSIIGVSTTPGEMAFTRIPHGASSHAAAPGTPRTAHLLAAYAYGCPPPFIPATEQVLMMTPLRWSRMTGATAAIPRNTPVWLTATTLAYSSGVVSSRPLLSHTPALFTRMSMRSHRRRVAATTSAQARWSVTSSSWNQPCSPSSAATSAPAVCGRSVTTTRAPSRANSRATAAPWPRAEPAPVTMATLPVNAATAHSLPPQWSSEPRSGTARRRATATWTARCRVAVARCAGRCAAGACRPRPAPRHREQGVDGGDRGRRVPVAGYGLEREDAVPAVLVQHLPQVPEVDLAAAGLVPARHLRHVHPSEPGQRGHQ